MGLIKVKAKVMIVSEDDLEWDEESMGKRNRKDNPYWDWRMRVIDTTYIYELTEFTKNKTIIEMCDGRLVVAAESIDSLHSRWQENKERDLILGDGNPSEDDIEDDEND